MDFKMKGSQGFLGRSLGRLNKKVTMAVNTTIKTTRPVIAAV